MGSEMCIRDRLTPQQEEEKEGGQVAPVRKSRPRNRRRGNNGIAATASYDDLPMEPGWSTPRGCPQRRSKQRTATIHLGHGKAPRGTGVPKRGVEDDGSTGGDPTRTQTGNSAHHQRAPQGGQQQSRRPTRRNRNGKSGKAKRPASWSNHKRISSAITRDVSCVEDWDAEIEEEARRTKEAAETTETVTAQLPDCLLYTSPSPRDS